MIFTRNAYARYRQFHMLDQPTATDEDARALLEAHGALAARLPGRTHRGDEVWTIHALGVELVVKRDGAARPRRLALQPSWLTPLPARQRRDVLRVRRRGLTDYDERDENETTDITEHAAVSGPHRMCRRESRVLVGLCNLTRGRLGRRADG